MPRDQQKSVLIKNIKYDTPPATIREVFEAFGPLRDVYLPLDFKSGRPRGFGFVEFEEEADADEAAFEMNGTVLDGNELLVQRASDTRKDPEAMRKKLSTGSGKGKGGSRDGTSSTSKKYEVG